MYSILLRVNTLQCQKQKLTIPGGGLGRLDPMVSEP